MAVPESAILLAGLFVAALPFFFECRQIAIKSAYSNLLAFCFRRPRFLSRQFAWRHLSQTAPISTKFSRSDKISHKPRPFASERCMYARAVEEGQPAVRMAELAEAGRPFWFCLKAAPKREHLAATALRRELQVPVVAPRIRFRKLTSRGPVWFVEAMFPGYLFAEFIYAELHRRVVHTHGVTGLVRFGDHVPTIEATTLDAFRTAGHEVVTFDRPLEVGETVKIAEGPFQGFEAVVTRLLPAANRVRILLEFLGRGIEIAVHEPQVISPRMRTGT